MLSEQCDHSMYLRSMWTSCCSRENSRGILESLLNPRLISARVSFSSTILQNEEAFIIQICTALVSVLFAILWTTNHCPSLPGWHSSQLVFAEVHICNRTVTDCIKHIIRYRCLLFFTKINERGKKITVTITGMRNIYVVLWKNVLDSGKQPKYTFYSIMQP